MVNQNDGFDIEEIINDIKEKDPQAYTPIVLPFEKNDDEGKSLKDNFIELIVDNFINFAKELQKRYKNDVKMIRKR